MNSRLPDTPQSPALAGTSAAAHEIPTSAMSIVDKRLTILDEPTVDLAETSNKRKRESDDDGGPEQKKVHIENGTPGIEALHRDVGPPYRLASTRKTPFFAGSICFWLKFKANIMVNIDFNQ